MRYILPILLSVSAFAEIQNMDYPPISAAIGSYISGTANSVPKFTGANVIGDSGITDDGTGGVGIGVAPTAGYSLTTSTGIYAGSVVSAEFFVDRTPYPNSTEEAYAAIDSMTREAGGGVDHESLHPFVKNVAHISAVRDDKGDIIEAAHDVEGRDLSATVSALVEVVKALKARIEVLENK